MPCYLQIVTTILAATSSAISKPTGSRVLPSDRELDNRNFQNARGGAGTYAIGVPGNGVQPRLEIRALENDPDAWNVFLLGVKWWQEMDPNDMLSYYKVMGIHGRQEAWDGVQQANGGGGGYCTHGSNIFLTWHRPYCQLIEECVLDNAKKAVSQFSNGDTKDRYNKVLDTLRVPYYDWAKNRASGEQILPSSFQRPTVQLNMPDGARTVSNPLFAYTFPSQSREDFKDSNAPWWAEYPTTFRIPTSKDANAASRNDVVENELEKISTNLRERVYYILTLETDFNNVSTYAYDDDSLESVHDMIHVTIGGDGGHMQDVPMSSFDPIFITHHVMIDHIAAMWQKGHPDSYVQPQAQKYTTFSRPSGANVDENSPLFPFHKDSQGNFWSSLDVRDPTLLGYTYPDIADDPATLKQTIEALYGNPTASQNQKRDSQEVQDGRTADNRIYAARIKAPKFVFSGSYLIYVFIGEPPLEDSDPLEWTGSVDYAGSSAIFASAIMKQQIEKEISMVNTVVPLTWTLQKHVADGKLTDLSQDVVCKYLKENMSWRIRSIDNRNIPLGKVTSLELSVVTMEVKPGENMTAFPIAGVYETVLTDFAGLNEVAE